MPMVLLTKSLRQIKRVIVFVVGMTVVLLGIAMLVLPGPAMIVIPAGLAILAIEFAWARRLLDRAKDMVKSARDKVRGGPKPETPETDSHQNDVK
jgi:tellurite resistance protein TerC